MATPVIRKVDPALGLLALAAFLGPVMGGQVSLTSQPLAPGAAASALLNGPELPLLSHALIALPAIAAFCLLFFRRKVIQIPTNTMTMLVLTMMVLLSASLLVSGFRSVTIAVVAEFLLSGVAMFAVVAGAGRRQGPRILMQALVGGVSIIALRGLSEYAATARVNPSWRVFGTWVQPNAFAAMLLIGFFVALALWLDAERLERFALGVAVVVIALTLFLTGSKGGLLCWFVTLFPFVALAGKPKFATSAALIGVCVVMIAGAVMFQKSVGGAAGSRVGNVAAETEQSAGFRTNLWKGIPAIVQRNPLGVGLGAYRFHSATSGLTTETKYAHQTYLQLATEASCAAPLMFVAVLGYWGWQLLRLRKTIDPRAVSLQAGVLCGVLAIALHSLIDSDLYYFGVLWSVFLLLGVGLLLAGDAVAPEFLPVWVRGATAVFGVFVLGSLTFFGEVEMARAKLVFGLQAKDRAIVQETIEAVKANADLDGESCKLALQASSNAEDSAKYADRLVQLAPSASNLRLIARVKAGFGQLSQAESMLRRALRLDPNNPTTLTRLADMLGQEEMPQERLKILARIVEVESTPYFAVRSLPQFIPTETYFARVEIAKSAKTDAERIKWLAPAVSGFKRYLEVTVPQVQEYARLGVPSPEGDDMKAVATKMETAKAAAEELSKAYRATGAVGDADAAVALAARFEAALSVTLK